MHKVFAIIKKNLSLLIRSKTSALIVILGPLLMILLIGAAFNTSNLYDIKVASYSESYSELSNSIVDLLTQSQFQTTKTITETECVEGVKKALYHVCMVIPKDLSLKSENANIVFYVDSSRVNIVWIILSTVSSKIEAKSSELSLQMTQAILTAMSKIQIEVTDKKTAADTLTSGIQDVSSKVSQISLSLSALNLDYNLTDFNISEIKEEANSVAASQNTSAATLNSLLDDLSTKLSAFGAKLAAASKFRESSAKTLDEAKTSLSSNTEKANSIKSALSSIESSINSIEIKEAKKIVSPITTSLKTVTTEKTHLSFMFPTLLVLVIMFVSILLSSTTVIKEKTGKAYFRNYISPTSNWTFILAHYLTNLFIIMLQLLVIFIVASFFFKKEILSNLPSVLLALFIVSSAFILLGMLIGYLFRTEETSNLASISVASVLIFFSNAILPMESMPVMIAKIAHFNPFVISEAVIKQLFIFGSSLKPLITSIGLLLSYSVLFVALIWASTKVRKEADRMMRKRFDK